MTVLEIYTYPNGWGHGKRVAASVNSELFREVTSYFVQ